MQPDGFDNQTKRTPNPVIMSIIVVVILAVAGGVVYAATRGEENTTSTTTSHTTSQPADTTTSSSPGAASSADSTYADGTYTATGSYSTPGGSESVTVTATLASGNVTSVTTTGSATGGNSAQYQSQFLSNYESQVVGKSIDEISLSRVAGSSLTSAGFNAALAEIKRDALS